MVILKVIDLEVTHFRSDRFGTDRVPEVTNFQYARFQNNVCLEVIYFRSDPFPEVTVTQKIFLILKLYTPKQCS